MGRPEYIFGRFRETARCRDAHSCQVSHHSLFFYLYMCHKLVWGLLYYSASWAVVHYYISICYAALHGEPTQPSMCRYTDPQQLRRQELLQLPAPDFGTDCHLRDVDLSYSGFQRSLKTFLFGYWGHGAVWTTLIAPPRNNLTYLLMFAVLCAVQPAYRWVIRISPTIFQTFALFSQINVSALRTAALMPTWLGRHRIQGRPT